jgi:broad specificity phosphatase PhoE
MVRHGETVGNSRERLHGAADLPLSDAGRAQMLTATRNLEQAQEVFDWVAASPLRRSWESAAIVTRGAPVQMVPEFREIDFGRWEGMSADEIQAADPARFKDWQARAAGFEYPGGEQRAAFRARVVHGFARVEHSGARDALLVVHKGVIRTIAEQLLGAALPGSGPELGESVGLSRDADGRWFLGRHGSDPPGLSR